MSRFIISTPRDKIDLFQYGYWYTARRMNNAGMLFYQIASYIRATKPDQIKNGFTFDFLTTARIFHMFLNLFDFFGQPRLSLVESVIL